MFAYVRNKDLLFMIDLYDYSSLYSIITLKAKDMEWLLEDGNYLKKVISVEEIVAVIQNVMEEKCEFIILSPSTPIKSCNYMQAAPAGANNMHIEVSILQPTGKSRTFSRVCTPDVAVSFFTLFYIEDVVPDVKDWTFEGEFD